MAVPLLDLKRENQPLLAEIQQALQPIYENSAFVLGKVVDDMEAAFHKALELPSSSYVLGVSSGTDALLLALMALKLPAGTEVITTPFTFFATAGSIHRAHLKPRFVDIDPVSFNINPALIAEKITAKTKVIMPVHLYGQMADMTAIMALAKKNQLTVIEDAAQGLGSRWQGKQAGSYGDFCGISFYPTKNLGAFGDAGLLVGNNPAFQEAATVMRVHGSKTRYEHLEVGGNFRIDAIQAVVVHIKLKHLEEWQNARRANAKRYHELLSGLEEHLVLPAEVPGAFHTYNQFVVRVKNNRRAELMEFLNKKQIGNVIFYPSPLHVEKCFSELGYKKGDFPEAEKAAAEVLALPIYPFLAKAEQDEVADVMREFFRK